MKAARFLHLAGGLLTLSLVCQAEIDPNYDPKFGGRPTVKVIADAPDGSMFVAGIFDRVNASSHTGLVKLLGSGTTDSTFDSGASPAGAIDRLRLLSDGRLFVAGSFRSFGGIACDYGVILSTTGAVSQTFPYARPDSYQLRYFALSTGNFIISEEWHPSYVADYIGCARLQTNGSIDPSFGSNEKFITAVAEVAGGKLIIATQNGGIWVKRLNVDGSVDGTFTPVSFSWPVHTIVPQTDGRILVGGEFGGGISRLNVNGGLDTAFESARGTGIGAGGPYEYVHAIRILPDNHILAGGNFYSFAGSANAYLVRLTADGLPESSAMIYDGAVYSIGSYSLLIGGAYSWLLGQDVFGFARLSGDGTVDATFRPLLTSRATVGIYGIAGLPGSMTLVAGTFLTCDDVEVPGLVRLDPAGNRDPSFQAPVELAHGVQRIYPINDGRIFVLGIFPPFGGMTAQGFVRLNSNGTLDPTFDTGITLWPGAILPDSDGSCWAMVNLSLPPGNPANNLVHFTATGAIDPAFSAPALELVGGGQVFGLRRSADRSRILVFGNLWAQIEPPSQYSSSGLSSAGVAAFHLDGSLDSNFVARLYSNVYDILPLEDGSIIAAGNFDGNGDEFGWVNRQHFARLLPDGQLDRNFVPPDLYYMNVNSVNMQPPGRILALTSGYLNGVPSPLCLVRFTPSGSVDPSFTPVPGDSSPYPQRASLVQDDGSVVFGPVTTPTGGVMRRLLPETGGPTLIESPKSQRRVAGASVLLQASASGALPMTASWTKDASPIAGGANGGLLLAPMSAGLAGDYRVNFTNPNGGALSQVAHLELNLPPQISPIPDVDVILSQPPLNVPFTVIDEFTPPAGITVSLSSPASSFFNFYPQISGSPGNLSLNIPSPFYWLARGPGLFADVTVRAIDGDDGATEQTFRARFRDQTYDEWAQQYFSSAELANPMICGSDADPDHDGIPNFLEFVWGGNPRYADPWIAPVVTYFPAAPEPGGRLHIQYYDLWVGDSVQQTVEVSSDLQSWDASSARFSVLSQDYSPTSPRHSVTLSTSGPGVAKLFVRIRIQSGSGARTFTFAPKIVRADPTGN